MSLFVVISLAGCSTENFDDSANNGANNSLENLATETVTRGDITQVVSLNSSISASPKVLITAPSSGVVSLNGNEIVPSKEVKKGTPLFHINGNAYLAQYDFVVDELPVINGSTVPKGLPVIKGAYQGFAQTATLPPEAAYRILDSNITIRALIINGPGPFDCEPVQIASSGSDSDTKKSTISCLIPKDIVAYDGLAGIMAVKSMEKKNVLLLPCSAVSGSFQSGEVFAVVDKKQEKREVKLGISNGTLIEITGGLNEGDVVSAVPPKIGQG
jgi:hypothetical protein